MPLCSKQTMLGSMHAPLALALLLECSQGGLPPALALVVAAFVAAALLCKRSHWVSASASECS